MELVEYIEISDDDESNHEPTRTESSDGDDRQIQIYQENSIIDIFDNIIGDEYNFYSRSCFEEVATPKIDVEGVGSLHFPLSKELIKQLIEKAKGTRNKKTDKSEPLEFAANELKNHGGKQWNIFFNSIKSKIVNDLGLNIPQVKVSAILVKLVIYQNLLSYNTHHLEPVNNSNSNPKFGKLIISLPTEQKGGDMVLSYGGKTVNISLENNSYSNMKYIAFYDHVRYQIQPLTQGYRVCLIYSLSYKIDNDIFKQLLLDEQQQQEVNKKQKTDNGQINIDKVIMRPVSDNQGIDWIKGEIKDRGYIVFIYRESKSLKLPIEEFKGRLLEEFNDSKYCVGEGELVIKEEGECDDDGMRIIRPQERTITCKVNSVSFQINDSECIFPPTAINSIKWDFEEIREFKEGQSFENGGGRYEKRYNADVLVFWKGKHSLYINSATTPDDLLYIMGQLKSTSKKGFKKIVKRMLVLEKRKNVTKDVVHSLLLHFNNINNDTSTGVLVPLYTLMFPFIKDFKSLILDHLLGWNYNKRHESIKSSCLILSRFASKNKIDGLESVLHILEVAAGLETPINGQGKEKIITIRQYLDFILDCYDKYITLDIKTLLYLVDCIKTSLNKIGGKNQEGIKQISIQTIDCSIELKISDIISNNSYLSVESIQSIIDTPHLEPEKKKSLVIKLLPILGKYIRVYEPLVKIHQKHPEYLTLDSLGTIFIDIIYDLKYDELDKIGLMTRTLLFKSSVLVFKDEYSLSTLLSLNFKNSKAQIEALRQIHLEHQYNTGDRELDDLIAKFWCYMAARVFHDIDKQDFELAANKVTCTCNDCVLLKQWLMSEDQTQFQLKALKKKRDHIEKQLVVSFKTTLDIKTEEDRLPFTLVVKKIYGGQALYDTLNNDEILKIIQSLKDINSYTYPEMIHNNPFVTNIYHSIEKRIKQLENREPLTLLTLSLPNIIKTLLLTFNNNE